MGRKRHTKKEVEAVVQYAESLGWRFVPGGGGHRWGSLLCPQATRDGCIVTVNSTPENPGNHARKIRRQIDSCHHQRRRGR